MPFARHFSLTAVLGLLSLAAIPSVASAAEGHAFKESFGSAAQPSFEAPQAPAVDQASGDLLVVDRLAGTLNRFKPNGEPDNFSALTSNVIDGKEGEADETPQKGLSFIDPRVVQVAVDNSGTATDGDIYVTQFSNHLIDIFSPTGAYLGQLTEFKEGTGAGGALKPLGETCGVAVDSAGAVYVGDFSGEIHKYVPGANPVSNADNKANFVMPHVCMLAAGAGPTAGFLFAGELDLGGEGHVLKLDAGTGEVKYAVSEATNQAVTVDPGSGHVYVVSGVAVNDFDASGASDATLLDSFTGGIDIAQGIVVNGANGNVYVTRNGNHNVEVWETFVLPEAISKAASAITSVSATLHGEVSAAGGAEASCKFEYTTEARFNKEGFTGASSAACVPPGPFTGSSLQAVSATVSGLVPGTPYKFRVVGTSSKGSNPKDSKEGALGFLTLGPTIVEEAVSNITASEVRIAGRVNPNGKATSFAVEYVSNTAFETEGGYATATTIPFPERAIGSGSTAVAVAQQLSGLAEASKYHFRLVATNADAVSFGADQSFTTRTLAPALLPDNRAFELVSPAQKIGEVIPPEQLGVLNGTCAECLPGHNDQTMPMQARPDGDAVAFEGQPFSGGVAVGANEYRGARGSAGWGTSDLSKLDFASGRGQGINGFGAFSADLTRGVLAQSEPTLSSEAPVGPEGTAFSNLYLWVEGVLTPLVTSEPPHRTPGTAAEVSFRTIFAGANPDFTHLIFEANDALTGGVAGLAPEAPLVGPSLCKATAAECDLYEWTGGELRLVNVLPGNVAAAPGAVIGSGRQLGGEFPNTEAPDVDHAISADGRRIFWSTAAGQVYVRVDGEETQKIEDGGRFLTAAADGSRVLLSDGCLYSLEAKGCEAHVGVAGSLQGILGASEDLSHVYFVDTAALTGTEENANEEAAEAGKFNLYAWSQAGGVRFIGRLAGGDNGFGFAGSMGDWKAMPQNRTAQVSPDGEYLAFMSRAALSGYDSEVAGASGECGKNKPAACAETFEYAAASGELICASCNPTGARPLGGASLSLIRPNPGAPFPQPHNLTANGQGRLFFESQDTLSPKDTNGHIQDVYEWEPNGVGSCEKAGGCQFLISSGHSPNDSMFVDSTPSGNDAFFITREQLVSKDKDEMLDLYDARVNGGIEEAGTAPCGGEGCKGPVAEAPAQPSAGSGSFAGPGNQKPVKPKPKPKKKHKPKKHHKKAKHKKRAAKHRKGGRSK